jgi:FAD binding domain
MAICAKPGPEGARHRTKFVSIGARNSNTYDALISHCNRLRCRGQVPAGKDPWLAIKEHEAARASIVAYRKSAGSGMGSSFLEAHEAFRNFFWLGAGLAPISIRDQLVRGVSIIEHALEERVEEGDRVLIVGAGAAGVSAALRAAEKGINCDLVDVLRGPFLVQARAGTRWVDPTQYDWPMDHWNRQVYPCELPKVPLEWVGDWAPLIAAAWYQRFRTLMAASLRQE